jgi:Curlin associated repeat
MCNDLRTQRFPLLPVAVLTVATACLSWPLWAADLSLLSDFGRADIPVALRGIVVSTGDVAGIKQSGDRNAAFIDQGAKDGQVDRGRNNAETWQEGDNSSAYLKQQGASNEIRLLQNGDFSNATLEQIGSNNQMSIQQIGDVVTTNSSQVGDGNQLVLVQQAGSQFISTQKGNQNQMLIDLPSGVYMNVDQTGNNLYLRVSP